MIPLQETHVEVLMIYDLRDMCRRHHLFQVRLEKTENICICGFAEDL